MAPPSQISGDKTGLRRLGLLDYAAVHEHRTAFVGLGIALVILGALAILLPFAASLVTTLALGWLLLLGGLAEGVHALANRRWGGFGWALASAALYVLAGFVVIAFPVIGTVTLTLALAVFLMVDGVFKIVRAVQHRAMESWGWLLCDGFIALALGVMLWLHWPSTAAWALGLLVGVDMLLNGTSVLLIGVGAREAARART